MVFVVDYVAPALLKVNTITDTQAGSPAFSYSSSSSNPATRRDGVWEYCHLILLPLVFDSAVVTLNFGQFKH